jgi:hypothetical protein
MPESGAVHFRANYAPTVKPGTADNGDGEFSV